MRKVLPVLLMLGVAACAGDMRWTKPGISDEGASVDLGSCRHAASREASRYYYPWGWGGGWGWGFGRRSSLFWQMRADNDRFVTENRLTSFCMRTKGYELTKVEKPQTQPPPPPASPEPPLAK
ncbi:MAG: hypothetical protein J0J01_16265 [Reyranella sp.]|uniref:hypothetical protein n=1 Tax=Reyranella sp. TaxID=1929291 RepID=UPI001AD5B58F|nr:hypothetical protein [Reyranella sp.]MBN9088460.1 hypothetical protein [Reyranella sp.]